MLTFHIVKVLFVFIIYFDKLNDFYSLLLGKAGLKRWCFIVNVVSSSLIREKTLYLISIVK